MCFVKLQNLQGDISCQGEVEDLQLCILVGWIWLDAPAQTKPLPLLCRLAGWGDTGAGGARRDGDAEQEERHALVSPSPGTFAVPVSKRDFRPAL